jgi:hypothetical protein
MAKTPTRFSAWEIAEIYDVPPWLITSDIARSPRTRLRWSFRRLRRARRSLGRLTRRLLGPLL